MSYVPVPRLPGTHIYMQLAGRKTAVQGVLGHCTRGPGFLWKPASHSATGAFEYKMAPLLEKCFKFPAILVSPWEKTRLGGTCRNLTGQGGLKDASPNLRPRGDSSLGRDGRINGASQSFVLLLQGNSVDLLINVVEGKRHKSEGSDECSEPLRHSFA